ncbi:MAG: HlyD family efflux transporter periplasmic adaptor subunit [Bacillota bacterium]|nr:HlyD family efflux transporter periplasmic adaptor subunit [Bacillota bacterium]
MRKKVLAAVISAAIILGGTGAFFLFRDTSKNVTLSKACIKDIMQSIEVTGEIMPIKTCAAVSETGGRVAKVLVTEGKFVHEGDALFTLDGGAVSAMLEEATEELDALKGDSAVSASATDQLDALQKAKIALALAQATGYDYESFNIEAAGIDPSQIEEVFSQLDDISSGSGILTQQAAALLSAAEAKVAQLQEQVNCLTVRSTVSGNVLKCSVKEGDILPAGTPGVFVGYIGQLVIKACVNEKDLPSVRIGQKVLLTSDAVSGIWDGEISRISHMATKIQGAFGTETVGEVEITPTLGLSALPGMSVGVSIILNEALDVCTVPVESIVHEDEGAFVYIAADGVVEKRSIVTGLSDGFNEQVVEGVTAGEMVVLTPDADIVDGAKVRSID